MLSVGSLLVGGGGCMGPLYRGPQALADPPSPATRQAPLPYPLTGVMGNLSKGREDGRETRRPGNEAIRRPDPQVQRQGTQSCHLSASNCHKRNVPSGEDTKLDLTCN